MGTQDVFTPERDPSPDVDVADAERVRRWRMSLQATGLGVWDLNLLTGLAVLDERCAQIVGWSLSDLGPTTIETWTRMCHPDDVAVPRDAIRRHVQGGEPIYDVEVRLQHRAGHWVWVRSRGVVVEWDEHGRAVWMTGTHEDVTARRAAYDQLVKRQSQLDQAQRIANLGTWYLDLASLRMEWTGDLFTMLGLDPAAPAPPFERYGEFLTDESWARLQEALGQMIEMGNPDEVELEVVRPDGSHGWLLVRGDAARDRLGAMVGVRGVALDITERRGLEDTLRSLTTRDQLTGLANRAAAIDEIARSLQSTTRSHRPTAVIMVDLDDFKRINDSLGHSAGDDVIREAARRFERAIRGEDLLARLDGDAFVVVMRDLDDSPASARTAARLVDALREPIRTDAGEFHVTASVGIAVSSHSSAAEDLIRDADTAMFSAKAAGRGLVVVFNDDLRDEVTTRLSIESALRRAQAGGELEVHYQPEVRFEDSRIIAVEALLRWHHPGGELYTADRFISIAEDIGLIGDMGAWVLDQACEQGAQWRRDRPDHALVMRVNVSAVQMASRRMLPDIDAALSRSGLDPSCLCVEITESVLLRDTQTVASNLAGIHERGIQIAVDDFGTGFASLSYLLRYPVDVVKIDRSFVTHVNERETDARLVAGIVALASMLGYAVMAEGVETREQVRALRNLGCPSAQGFLFSGAVPARDLAELIDRGVPGL